MSSRGRSFPGSTSGWAVTRTAGIAGGRRNQRVPGVGKGGVSALQAGQPKKLHQPYGRAIRAARLLVPPGRTGSGVGNGLSPRTPLISGSSTRRKASSSCSPSPPTAARRGGCRVCFTKCHVDLTGCRPRGQAQQCPVGPRLLKVRSRRDLATAGWTGSVSELHGQSLRLISPPHDLSDPFELAHGQRSMFVSRLRSRFVECVDHVLAARLVDRDRVEGFV